MKAIFKVNTVNLKDVVKTKGNILCLVKFCPKDQLFATLLQIFEEEI